MGNSAFQKIRLLKVYKILEKHSDDQHPMTIADILDSLKDEGIYATRKTIYDDIRELNEFGYYVETVKGKSNGYFLDDRQFDTAEIRVLMSSVRASHFLSATNTKTLLDKLASLESRYQGRQLLRHCYDMGENKTNNKSVVYHISAIDDAIARSRKVSFVYTRYDEHCQCVERNNGERYVVSPIALLNSDNNYYLVAHSDKHGDTTIYRVDRMRDVIVEQEYACDTDRRLLDNMHKKIFAMHMGIEQQCLLEIDKSMTDIMVDKFGTDIVFVPTEDGKLQLSVSVYVSGSFISWCIHYGKSIRVLSPANVVADVKALVAELAEQYL